VCVCVSVCDCVCGVCVCVCECVCVCSVWGVCVCVGGVCERVQTNVNIIAPYLQRMRHGLSTHKYTNFCRYCTSEMCRSITCYSYDSFHPFAVLVTSLSHF